LAITTIRVMGRTDMFKAEGMMLKGMSIGEVRARCELKLCIVIISTKGMEQGKMVRGIRPQAHKGMNKKRIRLDAGKDIKGMGRDDVREAGDYSDAIPGIGGLKERSVNR
jgi:hypothetical protein